MRTYNSSLILGTKLGAEKDWSKADEVRDKLDKLGIVLDDTPDGTIWKKK